MGYLAGVIHRLENYLSLYHFAPQFSAANRLAPHQYVITCRVERAQHLRQGDGELGLAEVAFPRRLLGPKQVFLSLQADRRRHAGTLSDFRKNSVKVRKLWQELGRRVR